GALEGAGGGGAKRRGGRLSKRRQRGRRECRYRGKAQVVCKKAYLIVKRRDRLTAGERRQLASLLGYAPGLRVLRSFVDDVGRLFAAGQPEASAWRRRAALLAEPSYAAVPE